MSRDHESWARVRLLGGGRAEGRRTLLGSRRAAFRRRYVVLRDDRLLLCERAEQGLRVPPPVARPAERTPRTGGDTDGAAGPATATATATAAATAAATAVRGVEEINLKGGTLLLHTSGERAHPHCFEIHFDDRPSAVFSLETATMRDNWVEALAPLFRKGAVRRAFSEALERTNYRCEILPEDLEWRYDGTVGKGGFGVVRRALWLRSIEVAVKSTGTISLLTSDRREIDEFIAEIEILAQLRHPNIVSMFGYSLKDGLMCLVQEFVRGGDLRHFLREEPSRAPALKLALARTAAAGMIYLHSKSIIHRDLKPGNLLVESRATGTLKVCDFGLSGTAGSHAQGIRGSPAYSAPELSLSTHTNKVDVFSYGIVLYEIEFPGTRPWERLSVDEVVAAKRRGERPPLPRPQPPGAPASPVVDLIVRCWDTQPERRPTFVEIFAELKSPKHEQGQQQQQQQQHQQQQQQQQHQQQQPAGLLGLPDVLDHFAGAAADAGPRSSLYGELPASLPPAPPPSARTSMQYGNGAGGAVALSAAAAAAAAAPFTGRSPPPYGADTAAPPVAARLHPRPTEYSGIAALAATSGTSGTRTLAAGRGGVGGVGGGGVGGGGVTTWLSLRRPASPAAATVERGGCIYTVMPASFAAGEAGLSADLDGAADAVDCRQQPEGAGGAPSVSVPASADPHRAIADIFQLGAPLLEDFASRVGEICALPPRCISETLRTLVERDGRADRARWDNLMRWFGPILPAIGAPPGAEGFTLAHVIDWVSQPFFHGFLSSDESAAMLRNKPDGTFLFRFSSSPKFYTLSAAVHGGCFHWRISSTRDARLQFGDESFESFQDVVAKHSRANAPLLVEERNDTPVYIVLSKPVLRAT